MALSAEHRAKISAAGKRAWAEGRHKHQAWMSDGVGNSRRRHAQLAHEEVEANRLRADGYEVFSPTAVCDRVAIKDGRVYFVEFKRRGQHLATGQARVQALQPDRYLVVYSDPPATIPR